MIISLRYQSEILMLIQTFFCYLCYETSFIPEKFVSVSLEILLSQMLPPITHSVISLQQKSTKPFLTSFHQTYMFFRQFLTLKRRSGHPRRSPWPKYSVIMIHNTFYLIFLSCRSCVYSWYSLGVRLNGTSRPHLTDRVEPSYTPSQLNIHNIIMLSSTTLKICLKSLQKVFFLTLIDPDVNSL